MADIKNKNELKRRIELFLDELDYSINEKFCKETMEMMREFIGHASHQLDCKNSKIESLNSKLKKYQQLEKRGLLLNLKVKPGDKIFVVDANYYSCPAECEDFDSEEYYSRWCKENCPHGYKGTGVIPEIVKKVEIRENGIYVMTGKCGYRDLSNIYLTSEEAEQALAEMKGA